MRDVQPIFGLGGDVKVEEEPTLTELDKLRDFATDKWQGLPIWAWIAMAVAVLLALFVTTCCCCCRRAGQKAKRSERQLPMTSRPVGHARHPGSDDSAYARTRE